MYFFGDVARYPFLIAIYLYGAGVFVVGGLVLLCRKRIRALPEEDKISSIAVGVTTASYARRIIGRKSVPLKDRVIAFHIFPTELRFYCSAANLAETVSVPLRSFSDWQFHSDYWSREELIELLFLQQARLPWPVWFSRGAEKFKLILFRWDYDPKYLFPLYDSDEQQEFLTKIGAVE
jgi:hypothetical protein